MGRQAGESRANQRRGLANDEAGARRHAGVDVVISLLENEEIAQLGLIDERRVPFPKRVNSVPGSKSYHFVARSRLKPNSKWLSELALRRLRAVVARQLSSLRTLY